MNLVRRKTFKKEKGLRLGGITFDYKLIEQSQEMAEAWLNDNLNVEIVQIQTFHSGALAAYTVVWYREA